MCATNISAPATISKYNISQEWLNKPDGGAGWASYFLSQGYLIYIIDVWSVGRSVGDDIPPVAGGGTVELVQRAFTAPEIYHSYYQAQFHTQWPGVSARTKSWNSSDIMFPLTRLVGANKSNRMVHKATLLLTLSSPELCP